MSPAWLLRRHLWTGDCLDPSPRPQACLTNTRPNNNGVRSSSVHFVIKIFLSDYYFWSFRVDNDNCCLCFLEETNRLLLTLSGPFFTQKVLWLRKLIWELLAPTVGLGEGEGNVVCFIWLILIIPWFKSSSNQPVLDQASAGLAAVNRNNKISLRVGHWHYITTHPHYRNFRWFGCSYRTSLYVQPRSPGSPESHSEGSSLE